MSPDMINGLFELIGGVLILNHCRVLWADRIVRGVSLFSTVVFTSWGLWNLYYYPHLDQWYSFSGGLVIVAANTLWVGLMIYFGRKGRA